MSFNTTKIVFGSFVLLMVLSCKQRTEQRATLSNSLQNSQTQCLLQENLGKEVVGRFGCSNCHIYGENHMTDSTYLSNYGKVPTKNFLELAGVDSLKFLQYMIRDKHQGMYKGDVRLQHLTDCDIRNMIYYLHQAKLSKIYP